MTETARRPRLPRRWTAPIAVLLVAALLVIIAWRSNTQLTPITARTLPYDTSFTYALHDQGYPLLLDQPPRPLPAKLNPRTGTWRVFDSGVYYVYPQGLFSPEGEPLPWPDTRHQYYIPMNAVVADARFLPVCDENGTTLYLYDVTRRTFARRVRYTFSPGHDFAIDLKTVFLHGSRMALVLHPSTVLIYEGTRCLSKIDQRTNIYYGHDGAIWWQDGATLYTLHWRTGTPRVETSACPAPSSVITWWYASPFPMAYSTVALRADGACRAEVETISPAPIVHWFDVIPGMHFGTERRRLTLRYYGRVIGTYSVPLTHINSGRQRIPTPEHLAFSRDGRHLCWITASSNHPETGMKLFVFEVPKGAR